MFDLLASTIIRQTSDLSLANPFSFTAPVSSGYSESRRHPITGHIGPHRAIDLVAPYGTQINSPISGTVKLTSSESCGLGFEVQNATQQIQMCHLSSYLVRSGDNVTQGSPLGKVGSSGWSTGPHLHLAYSIFNGIAWVTVNPQLYLKK